MRSILPTSLLSSHCLLAVTPIHNIETAQILLYMTIRFVFNLDNYVLVHYEYTYYLHEFSLINSVRYEITAWLIRSSKHKKPDTPPTPDKLVEYMTAVACLKLFHK